MGLKYLLGLDYIAAEGFTRGVLSLSGLSHLPAPEKSTINDRELVMQVKLPKLSNPKAGYAASIDSTGLKIHGQGERNLKKHKQKDRTNWVKMHLAIDAEALAVTSVK